MKILLVVDYPNSSLDVLAQAIIASVEKQEIEVFLLYKRMFLETIKACTQILDSIKLVHFLNGVEGFPYEIIELVSRHCPIITHYHHCEFRGLPKQFSLIKQLFYVSRSLAEEVKSLGILKEKASLIYSGVDTDMFYPKYKKKSDIFTIGFFGVHVPNGRDRKGSVLLVRAVRRLVDLGHRPSFLIVGYGWQKLVADLRRMGLKVLYHVNVPFDNLPELYRRLDLYLITSLLEGGPLTLLEAGACGIPIISTPVGLSLEILTKPGCGKLLSGFDSDEIATAIVDDIENYEQARKRAGFVLEEICKNWNWKFTYHELHKVYYEVSQLKQKTEKLDTSYENSLMPYLDFKRDAKRQRMIAKQYALLDLAFRLYDYGEQLAAWRMAFSLIPKIHPLYWWRIIQSSKL